MHARLHAHRSNGQNRTVQPRKVQPEGPARPRLKHYRQMLSVAQTCNDQAAQMPQAALRVRVSIIVTVSQKPVQHKAQGNAPRALETAAGQHKQGAKSQLEQLQQSLAVVISKPNAPLGAMIGSQVATRKHSRHGLKCTQAIHTTLL